MRKKNRIVISGILLSLCFLLNPQVTYSNPPNDFLQKSYTNHQFPKKKRCSTFKRVGRRISSFLSSILTKLKPEKAQKGMADRPFSPDNFDKIDYFISKIFNDMNTEGCYQEEGIFRLSGKENKVAPFFKKFYSKAKTKEKLDRIFKKKDFKKLTCHDKVSLVKKVLSKKSESEVVFNYDKSKLPQDELMGKLQNYKQLSEGERKVFARKFLSSLDSSSKNILKSFMEMTKQVTQNQEQNKMNVNNIAIAIGGPRLQDFILDKSRMNPLQLITMINTFQSFYKDLLETYQNNPEYFNE